MAVVVVPWILVTVQPKLYPAVVSAVPGSVAEPVSVIAVPSNPLVGPVMKAVGDWSGTVIVAVAGALLPVESVATRLTVYVPPSSGAKVTLVPVPVA